MYKKNKILAIIPARSGSKGLKDKNIRELNGKPLIAYTIEAAKKSGIFDEIVVSTDSEEYANIARKYGAKVPFLRPSDLSKDTTSTTDVIINLLNYYKEIGIEFEGFMLLQPTSPLRDELDIINSLNLFKEKNANSVVSVCECEHSPLLTTNLDNEGKLDGFIKNIKGKRRQDLDIYYRLNGAIYLCKIDYFLTYKDFYKEKSFPYIMDSNKSIDIDDIYQFKLAEIIMEL